MSDSTAPSSIVAVERLGSIPFVAEALDHQRGGRADRVERRRDRDPRLDRADVVVVEDLDDLGLVDARHALGLLGVVDEHRRAGAAGETRSERVTRPDGAAVGVDHDGRAVVALADLLGDVGEQELGGDRQRVALHQRAARRGQRDHPARDVGVQRRNRRRRRRGRGRAPAPRPRGARRLRGPASRRRDRSRAVASRHGCRPPRRPRRRYRWAWRHPSRAPIPVLPADRRRRSAALRRAPRRSRGRTSAPHAGSRCGATRGCSGERARAR